MLVNNIKKEANNVKFISYTGSYPNLCRGLLTLEIDGVEYTFGNSWDPYAEFRRFWYSGGTILPDYSGIIDGEWYIDVNDIPEQFQKYATEIDYVFNENVDFGCCGGCI